MDAVDKIAAYGSEFGVDNLSVDTLIMSHRAMRDSIKSDQKVWLDMLEKARQKAFQEALDANWVRIEELKKMSVQDLVALLNDN